MFVKCCDPCQRNNTHKLEKCPHQMKSIKVPNEVWSQIGQYNCILLKLIGNTFVSILLRHKKKWFEKNVVLQTVVLICVSGVDLVGLLCKVNGKKYIVTAICYSSKYVEAKAIGSKNATENC